MRSLKVVRGWIPGLGALSLVNTSLLTAGCWLGKFYRRAWVFFDDVQGHAIAFESLWEEPGHLGDHHSNLDAAKHDWRIAEPVLVLLAFRVPHLHPLLRFALISLAYFWVELLPQVVRAELAVFVGDGLLELWQDLLFNELGVDLGVLLQALLFAHQSDYLVGILRDFCLILEVVERGHQGPFELPELFKVSLLVEYLRRLTALKLLRLACFLHLLDGAPALRLILAFELFKGA